MRKFAKKVKVICNFFSLCNPGGRDYTFPVEADELTPFEREVADPPPYVLEDFGVMFREACEEAGLESRPNTIPEATELYVRLLDVLGVPI